MLSVYKILYESRYLEDFIKDLQFLLAFNPSPDMVKKNILKTATIVGGGIIGSVLVKDYYDSVRDAAKTRDSKSIFKALKAPFSNVKNLVMSRKDKGIVDKSLESLKRDIK